MRAALSLFLAFPAFATARNTDEILLGGWSKTNVTQENTKLLTDALAGNSYSNAVGDTRVCYTDVTSLETQVVSGINYRFLICGCNVAKPEGKCSDTTLKVCTPIQFQVVIYEQKWTNTVEVKSIEVFVNGTSDSDGDAPKESAVPQIDKELVTKVKTMEFSEDEKKKVDVWIQANGLNQYGDDATRMYTGGTPLFNENTGMTTDRYAYILRRHPDRPWQSQTVTRFAVEQAADETLGQGSVAGVFAMLGVFTVVLAGVAIIKMHQGRRDRIRYNPIHSREQ